MKTTDTLTKTGLQLHLDDRAHVLRAYVHRYTGEHRPQWAGKTWKEGKPYPVQFADDKDWLAHTTFAVRTDGRLDRRHHACVSSPTWPNNPELRKGVAR